MTEPVEIKLKAQSASFNVPHSSGRFLRLAQVYKLIDQAYKQGIKDAAATEQREKN